MKHSPSRRVVTSTLIHWNYFLAIEDKIVGLSRYLELSEPNYKAYSTELAAILMASTQENDVLLKQIAGDTCKNEREYRHAIPRDYQSFTNQQVEISRFNLTFTPFAAWARKKTPGWWSANNKVKHQRHEYFKKATLENTLNSVAALLVANIYFYSKTNKLQELQPIPQLFNAIGLLGMVELTTTGIAPCYEIS